LLNDRMVVRPYNQDGGFLLRALVVALQKSAFGSILTCSDHRTYLVSITAEFSVSLLPVFLEVRLEVETNAKLDLTFR